MKLIINSSVFSRVLLIVLKSPKFLSFLFQHKQHVAYLNVLYFFDGL